MENRRTKEEQIAMMSARRSAIEEWKVIKAHMKELSKEGAENWINGKTRKNYREVMFKDGGLEK